MTDWEVRCCDNMDPTDGLPSLADNSIDAVVTDPPAGIGFMGMEWDKATRQSFVDDLMARLKECLRVLKPGGHALVWSLPRTCHWTMLAIEDAGFQIRDTIDHISAKAFPKTANVSKSIDKKLGVARKVVGANPNHRPVSGVAYAGVYNGGNTGSAVITEAGSEEAKKWEGWGTGLKPIHEVWVLARKPLDGTLTANVMKWGVGAINIDANRIPTTDRLARKLGKTTTSASGWKSVKRSEVAGKDGGRWPPNVVFSHADDCVFVGVDKIKATGGTEATNMNAHFPPNTYSGSKYKEPRVGRKTVGFGDSTGQEEIEIWECVDGCPVAELNRQAGKPADIYFPVFPFVYAKKASPKEKKVDGIANTHPTAKGVDLMRWLCRLITPPGGTVLDPYAGSGTTGVACLHEGFHFIGFEADHDYFNIAAKRLGAVEVAISKQGDEA